MSAKTLIPTNQPPDAGKERVIGKGVDLTHVWSI